MGYLERQQRYRAKRSREGHVRLEIWCPVDRAQLVRSVASVLAKSGPSPRIEAGGCIEGGGSPPMRAEPAQDVPGDGPGARGGNVVQLAGRRASGSNSDQATGSDLDELASDAREALALALPGLTDDEAQTLALIALRLVGAR